jgi:hypothetical protein
MSTVAPGTPAAPLSPALLDSEHFIDEHIRRTRRTLKLIDLSAGVLTLLVGLLAFLLVAGLIDHWVVPGGLGTLGRNVLFGVLLVGLSWYAWRQFVPLLRSINPVYAAHTIEKSSPTLKNSLLNLLLFRSRRQQMSAKVYYALEQQAAQRLSAAPADAALDRAALLRLGYMLVLVVAACALYSVVSPKNLAVSAGRVLAPWADLAAPSRVKILDIKPGDVSVAMGERLSISAEVLGAKDDEAVRLRYSTLDEQQVDESILMKRPAGAARFAAELPRASDAARAAGVQQDLTYWIEAGDARTRRFSLTVYRRPTIVVQRVRYEYPAYTGYPSKEIDNVGDISGLEGTFVTIHALANQPIKAAHVDFDADGRNDLAMKADGKHAVASFRLALRPDRRTPEHPSYVLRFVTALGLTNSDPAQYRIEVTPDYAPEVRITAPEEPELAVRVDETVLIDVEARDSDFALQQVRLVGRAGDDDVELGDVLSKLHEGRFAGAKPFTPADAGLQPGAVLEYWAEALDNRLPEANLAVSEHRRLRIVAPEDPAEQPQQQPNPGQGGQPKQEQLPDQDGEAASAAGEGDPQQQGEGAANNQLGEGEPQQAPGGAAEADGEPGEGEQPNGEAGSAAGDSGEQGENAANQTGAAGSDSEQTGDQQRSASGGGDSGESPDHSGDADAAANRREAGAEGSQPPGEEQEPVSAAGDEDGEAINRMREHFNQQDAASGESQGTEGESSDVSRDVAAEPAAGSEAAGESDPNGDGSETPEQGPDNGVTRDAQDNEAPGGEQATDPDSEGEPRPENADEDPAAADSGINPNQGDPGAGESSGENEGSPEMSPKNPTEKRSSGDDSEPPADDPTPPAGSQGKTESDSEGDQGGDRSGGGDTGAGQAAETEGQGAPGEHEAADEGGGAAAEPGQGEPGDEAGQQQTADGQTGESSETTPGGGSEEGDAEGQAPTQPGGGESTGDPGGAPQQPQPPGESASADEEPGEGADAAGGANGERRRPGAEPEGTPPPDASDEQSDPDDPFQDPDSTPGSAAGGHPQGGGQGGIIPEGESTLNEPGGDEANLAYARQQTDLVLERLDDQLAKQKVDPSLLNKLGWTEDELRQFVARWKGLKERAASEGENGDESTRDLDAALRALGLRRKSLQFRAAAVEDELRDLRDAYRGRAPLEWTDRVREYLKGAASAESGD